MWYGLLVNGCLECVRYFKHTPLIWDFHLGYYNSSNDYEVVELDISFRGKCVPYV